VRIANAARERGTPVPKFITEAPVLEDSYQARVIDAFWKLSTCRAIGMGCCGPIPWDSIHTYATDCNFNYTQVEYDVFCYLIAQLDEVFLKIQRDDMKRSSQTRSNQPTPPRPRRRR
jgi:hypothetical protein